MSGAIPQKIKEMFGYPEQTRVTTGPKTLHKHIDIALAYAAQGIPVFPCDYRSKRPLTKQGFLDATTDKAKIRNWWRRYPKAYIGSPNDKFVVVDYDTYKLKGEAEKIMNEVIVTLKHTNLLPDANFIVSTRSGGYHHYFAKDIHARRSINVLPAIDILANGGYVILPDQQDYICQTHDDPWNHINNLDSLDLEKLKKEIPTFDYLLDHVRSLMEKPKRGKPSKKRPEVLDTVDGRKAIKGALARHEVSEKVLEAIENTDFIPCGYIPKPGVDFVFRKNDGELMAHIGDGLYRATEKNTADLNFKLDWNFDTQGPYPIDPGQMNSTLLNALFHNQKAQMLMCYALGVTPPPPGRRHTVRSVLPNHADYNPSFGVRWTEDQSHIIFRDFTNKAKDRNNQIDFNVVRLFASKQYGTIVGRLSPFEFTVWCTRLMAEAGVIKFTYNKKTFAKELKANNAVTIHDKKVLDAVLYLDQVRSSNEKHDGIFLCTKHFLSAWLGMNENDNGPWNVLTRMKNQGLLNVDGYLNTKNDSPIYNTHKLIIRQPDMPHVDKRDIVRVNSALGMVDMHFAGIDKKNIKKIHAWHKEAEMTEYRKELEVQLNEDQDRINAENEPKKSAPKKKEVTISMGDTSEPIIEMKAKRKTPSKRKIPVVKTPKVEEAPVAKPISFYSTKPSLSRSVKVGTWGETKKMKNPITAKVEYPSKVNDFVLYNKNLPVRKQYWKGIENIKETFMNEPVSPQEDVYSYISMPISEKHYKKLVNFIKDENFEHTPTRENVCLTISISDRYEGFNFQTLDSIFMENIELVDDEEAGQKALYAFGDVYDANGVMTYVRDDIQGMELLEEPQMLFTITANAGEKEIDLSALTVKFIKYMGRRIEFTGLQVDYLDDDGVAAKLSGMTPLEYEDT